MADAAIGADLGQALDRLLPLPAQVALDLILVVDVALELRDLLVSEVLDLLVGGQPERGADLPRARGADSVDVGQPDLYVSPISSRFWFGRFTPAMRATGSPLSLSLLVPRIGTDDHGRAVPLDHPAPLTHGFDGRSDLHRFLFSVRPAGARSQSRVTHIGHGTAAAAP